MSYRKITDSDLRNVGVIGLPDTPQLSTDEMQAKFEETVRSVVIPAFNRLIGQLEERDSKTYTAEEVRRLINQTITDIGAGDMTKVMYDTDNDGVVDNAAKLGGNPPDHYMPKSGGTFTGGVQAYVDRAENWTIKNNSVVTSTFTSTGTNVATIYFVRK